MKSNRLSMVLALVWAAIGGFDAEAEGLSYPRTPSVSKFAAKPAATSGAAAADSGGERDLNMVKMPLEAVFEFYGKLVERTILKDPGVPNVTIDLQSKIGQKLTREEQIEAVEVVLEMNGIHLEKYGKSEKFMRAVARKDATKEGIPLYFDPDDIALGDVADGKVVSVMVSFKNISAGDEAQKALEGFKSNNGLLQVFERTNSILVTDTKQNIERMMKIARSIDIASPVQENVFVRQIKNAAASDVQAALQKIVEDALKYQEKDGKAQQNAKNAANRNASGPQTAILRRPGTQPPAASSVSLESIVASVSDADRGMIRGRVLIVPDERSNKLIIVTNDSNMKFFDKVIEALDVETTPDTVVKVYRLKYAESEDVADMINDLIGNSSNSKNSSKTNTNPMSRQGNNGNLTRNMPAVKTKTPANQRSGEAKAGELSKDNTTVLSDKRINGLVVMTDKELVPTIESIIESMDVRLSQVLIETVIIEVGLGDGLETGIDWISRGKAASTTPVTDKLGNPYYYAKDDDGNINYDRLLRKGETYTTDDETTWSASDVIATAASTVRDGFVSALAGGASYSMGGGAFGGKNAIGAMTAIATNFVNSGFNAIFKSDKLNIGAILHAVKTDSRSKYIASPVVMTVDNKEATIEATEMRYLFKGYQYSGSTYSGSPVKDYEQRDLGIKIKVTPKINPNGTVMLKVEEEYSQEGAGQMVDGETQATTVQRKMSADAVLENNMTVIFGGLTQTTVKEVESGIPLLKDIPWIGKWLFSSTTHEEARSELLVFMTPYVLDDAEAAQAEALRRKNAISDSRPWDDHGWSASALADPVAKKEIIRRLKDEAKKQDEERQSRIAIEKWKMDRAKALEQMDANERKFWLDTHRDDLEKEERKKFDEQLKEQSELKDLAEKIKAERMEKANAKIQENAKALEAENEHGRLEAEKKAAEAAEAAATEETPAE